MYIELLENIFWMEFGLTGVISGIMGGYMKLYDKNSWLYKESEGKNWLYDLSGMRSWGGIFIMIVWGVGFYTSLYEIIAKLIELFKK